MLRTSLFRCYLFGVLSSPILFFALPIRAQMLTPGQFQVSESGAATYVIPIQVSPGVAGMEPKLSLNYSSQSGNGLLGMGWSIGGLGGVSRCSRTIAQDGVRGSVNYDGNDRYCLDGQRLIAISGSEGGDGTEYRTERESFAKIVSYGIAGRGPASFKVWTKAGQMMEYGRTADSRIEAQGKTVIRLWALNRIEDTKGNYLTASYVKDVANGSVYPSRIDYAGNSKTNTVPKNSVQFQYETRPDIVPMYHAGSMVKDVSRMTKILLVNSEQNQTSYRFSYSLSSSINSSQLMEVKTCSANDVCLPPLALGYQSGDALYDFPVSNTPVASQYLSPFWKLMAGDVNGDGKTDIIAVYNNSNGNGDGIRIETMLSNGDGTYGAPIDSVTPMSGYLAPYWQLTTGDVNGDGKTDVIALYNNSNGSGDGARIVAMLSNGDGTFGPPIINISALTGYLAPYWRLTTGDVNGDGKTDVLALYNNSNGSGDGARVVAMLSNGDGTYAAPIITISALTGYLAPYWQLTTGDVNGDGKTDVLALYNNSNGSGDGMRIVAMLSNGDGTYRSPITTISALTGYLAPHWQLTTGDVNGDGKTDVLALYNNSNGSGDGMRIVAMLSNGDGTYGSPITTISTSTGYPAPFWKLTTGDANGDGRTDVFALYTNSNGSGDGIRVSVMLSNGDGSYGAPITSTTPMTEYLAPSWQLTTGDVNGDGKSDVIALYISSNGSGDGIRINPMLSKAVNQGALSTISTVNAVTSIVYRPITDRSVYTKDATTSLYPIQDVQAPLYVVSSVAASNGVGGTTSTNYTYGGLKSDLSGRGLLGFRWMQTRQVETGLTSYAEYLQSWPYTGLPSLIKKNLVGGGNNGVLSQISNSYSCSDAASTTAAACVNAAGKRYFVYANQSVESGWDYNGAVLPVITTKTEYDNWGNATKVDVSTSDGYAKKTVNTYSNDSSNWYLGRLLKSVVGSTSP